MAALNFPDPNVTTSYTNPDTGITYEWANGVWKSVSSALTAPELFVDVEGDNLTGNLTLGTDKIVLNATDGSASFAADVQIGENLGNAQSNTGGIFNLPDGRTILYHSSSETSPFIKCSKHDGITGSDVVTINDNGSATFAGSVQAGDLSVTVDNKNGSEIGSDGVLTLQRQSSVGSGNAIQIFQGAGTQPTTKIGADGSASFTGYVNVGNYVTGTGIRLNDWGEVISRVDGAKSAAFSAYQNGLAAGNVKARIYNDGSAEFASAVTVGPGNPSNGSNDGTILYGSGGLGVSKSSGALITFNQTGSGSTGQINADGSAFFDGYIFINRDTGTTSPSLLIQQGGNGTTPDNKAVLYSDGSAYFASNVGIGTASPQASLTIGDVNSSVEDIVVHTSNNGSARLRFREGGTQSSGFNEYSFGMAGNANALTFETQGQGEVIRIDTLGRLLVGTSSQTQVAKFVVQGQTDSATAGGYMRLQTNSSVVADTVLGTIGFGDGSHNGANIQSRGTMSWNPFGKGSALTFSTTSSSSTGPDERMRLDSSGRLLLGHSSSRSSANALEPHFQMEGINVSTSTAAIVRNENGAHGPILALSKSRGTSTGSNTVVQDGDITGSIHFAGADGTDLNSFTAWIHSEVDGTPGANDMPGRLVFSTTSQGASSPTERMRISRTGRVYIGNTRTDLAAPLSVGLYGMTLINQDAGANTSGLLRLFDVGAANNKFIGLEMRNKNYGDVRIINVDKAQTGTADMAFVTDDASTLSEKVRILSTGGLTFNGDTATANALEDYEEGTWTPSITNMSLGNGTITGHYTKIGNIVHLSFRLAVGSTTTFTSTMNYISGLPFTNSLASNTGVLTASNPSNNWLGYTQQYGIGLSTNYIQWVTSSNIQSVGSGSIPFTWAANTSMRFNMTYRAG
jgi:hypothetical protein